MISIGDAVITALAAGVLACGAGEPQGSGPAEASAEPARSELAHRTDLPASMRAMPPVSEAEQDRVFDEAARAAWEFVERHRVARTGLVAAQPDFPYPTIWDIGSTLGAYYSARELGFIDDDGYRERVLALLETMQTVPLYDGAVFGRNYDARNGNMVDERQQPTENGTGYSALDLGRLLVWLRIVADSDPALAEPAAAVAGRIDEARVSPDNYLYGEQLNPETGRIERFQEGRIGYEQYAARGFALWGMEADDALELEENLEQATVLGRPVPADERGLDRLTSEPFVLLGLELGLDGDLRRAAERTLAAQAERYAQTGQVTIASEDAIPVEPHYFYYYCVYCDGQAFVINIHTPGVVLDEPRWVSTKAGFGWHALMPSAYTWEAIEYVQPALDPRQGWASGVYESDGGSTGGYTLNTAAVILESAAVRERGRPLYSG